MLTVDSFTESGRFMPCLVLFYLYFIFYFVIPIYAFPFLGTCYTALYVRIACPVSRKDAVACSAKRLWKESSLISDFVKCFYLFLIYLLVLLLDAAIFSILSENINVKVYHLLFKQPFDIHFPSLLSSPNSQSAHPLHWACITSGYMIPYGTYGGDFETMCVCRRGKKTK